MPPTITGRLGPVPPGVGPVAGAPASVAALPGSEVDGGPDVGVDAGAAVVGGRVVVGATSAARRSVTAAGKRSRTAP
jgi:hypothetical protein